MSSYKAVVKDGRLVLDEPTELPDGTVIELHSEGIDELSEEELARLDASLDRSAKQADAGQLRPASEILAELRASR